MGLFDRFKKEGPDAGLERLQEKGDALGLIRAYIALGKEAYAQKDLGRTGLWIGWAKTIYSCDDDLFEAVGEQEMDLCDRLALEAEEAPLLNNQLLEQIEENFDALGGNEKRIWGLLTLCRLEKLLTRLGTLPGCDGLRDTGAAIDALLTHYFGEVSERGWNSLEFYYEAVSELDDSPVFTDLRSTLPAPAGAFQFFDFNGDILFTELSLYLGVVVDGETTDEDFAGQVPQAVLDQLDMNDQSGLIRCGLLTDYWLRVCPGKQLDEIPQARAEAERVMDDLSFLQSGPSQQAVLERASEYRKLDLLA